MMPDENLGERAEALGDLIEFRRPVVEAASALAAFPWDSPELVKLTRQQLADAVGRCWEGTISTEDLRAWAEALDGREDVSFEVGGVDLRGVLFELATPELFGDVKSTMAELLERLK